ncbi:MAG: hypothetical protein EYC68_07385 [Chloroflexota bacterium]|nr:MAG: hypothetical protein EYC68_07385 [Chloroflexota bacterium]
MGHTLPSATQVILNEQAALAQFRRALRQPDQAALDDLFRAARFHVAALANASHLLPFEAMLLAMLMEEHKRVRHLEILLERLLEQIPHDNTERMAIRRVSLAAGDDGLDD